MKAIFLFIALLLSFQNNFFAQDDAYTFKRVDSISIFFKYNDSKNVVISDVNKAILDRRTPREGLKFKLIGYSDTTGIDTYNQWLSEQRISSTKLFLTNLFGNAELETLALGENHGIKIGALARRVDVLIFITEKLPIIEDVAVFDTVVNTGVADSAYAAQTMRIRQVKKQVLNIMFVPDRSIVLNQSLPEVEKLYQTVKSLDDYKIELHGHVCCANEKRLSKRRARTIKKMLIAKGISKKRIKIYGHGNKQPLTEEKTEEEKAQNRRVEAIFKPILKKENKKEKKLE